MKAYEWGKIKAKQEQRKKNEVMQRFLHIKNYSLSINRLLNSLAEINITAYLEICRNKGRNVSK